MTTAYATVADYRAYMNQVKDTASRDSVIASALSRARGLIDVALKFSFFSVDVDTGAVDAWPSAAARIVRAVPSDHWLRLPAYQAGSVSSITYQDGSGATQTLTDWVEDWNGGAFCLYRAADTTVTPYGTSQLWGDGPYTVTAVWGFGPPIPAVAEINIQLAINLVRAGAKGGYEVIGGGAQGSPTLATVGLLSPAQRAVLDDINRQYVDWVDWGRV